MPETNNNQAPNGQIPDAFYMQLLAMLGPVVEAMTKPPRPPRRVRVPRVLCDEHKPSVYEPIASRLRSAWQHLTGNRRAQEYADLMDTLYEILTRLDRED